MSQFHMQASKKPIRRFRCPVAKESGPAEFDLTQLQIREQAPSVRDLEYLFRGKTGTPSYDGKYGEASFSGGGQQAGTTNAMCKLADCKRFQYPDKSFDPPNSVLAPLSSYTNPADSWGRMSLGLDYRGQPVYWKPNWKNEIYNNPYDINLTVGGPGRASGGSERRTIHFRVRIGNAVATERY